jgi:hypothetical protein
MTFDAAAHLRCQDLVHRLWNALDHRRLDEVMSLMTPDARWQRDRWYEGADAIRAALEARPADRTIRHVVTNLIVDADGAGFQVRMLLIPQMAKVAEGMSAPFKASPMASVADLKVRITAVGEALKVSEISFEPVFRPGG